MKKTMMLLMTFVLVSTLGTAFAADNQTAVDRSDGLYNGITTFDLGPAYTCQVVSYTTEKASAAMSYNGITVFDLGQPGPGAKGSCANLAANQTMMSKVRYNGITVF